MLAFNRTKVSSSSGDTAIRELFLLTIGNYNVLSFSFGKRSMGTVYHSIRDYRLSGAHSMRLDNDENRIVYQMLYSVSTKSSESRRHRAVFLSMKQFVVNLLRKYLIIAKTENKLIYILVE